MNSPVLEAHGLSKKYNRFEAVRPLDLTIQPGEIVVLQGHNGSGKTTLLNCLSFLIPPSTGSVSIAGFDMLSQEQQARRHLAYVPDVPRFFLELSAWEHLRFVAAANQALDGFEERAERLLREFHLWQVRDQFPHRFSRGMRLKMGLLLGLIRPSSILLLDEPTSALDQDAVRLLKDLLRSRKAEGLSTLFSAHDPTLSEQLADRCLVMTEGSLQTETP